MRAVLPALSRMTLHDTLCARYHKEVCLTFFQLRLKLTFVLSIPTVTAPPRPVLVFIDEGRPGSAVYVVHAGLLK